MRTIKPRHVLKLGLLIAALFLFTFALVLLREGAGQFGPFLRNSLRVENAANSLGFGWLFAYGVMSGSPVAAITLTLLDAGSLDRLEAFAMINGSRLGASFIVLFIGFIYNLRGKGEGRSLSTGLLSLLVTQTTYIPALFLGAWVLNAGWLDRFQVAEVGGISAVFDRIFDPLVAFLLTWLPRWGLFAIGLLVLLGSFSLLDRALPEISLEKGGFQGMARILYRPMSTFLLGGAVTFITMSVSLSVSILVPLSVRGYVRRENIIPYVMGANITTFIDTLIAAVLLGNADAFTVVLLEMLSIGTISLIIIGLFYRRYERFVLDVLKTITRSRRNLAIYMIGIVGIPVLLMLI
jgi:solute carrier family 34 (sodium-dependent phosphate cotransporter)